VVVSLGPGPPLPYDLGESSGELLSAVREQP